MTEVQEVNHSRIVVFTWYRRNVYIRKHVGFACVTCYGIQYQLSVCWWYVDWISHEHAVMSNHIITSQHRIPPLHDHEPSRTHHQTCLLPVLMFDPGSTYTGQWVGDDRSGEGVQVWKEIWMWHDVTVLSRWNGHNLQLKKGSSDIDRSNIERKFTLRKSTLNVKKPDDYRMHNIIHIFLHVSILVVGFVLRYNLPVLFIQLLHSKIFQHWHWMVVHTLSVGWTGPWSNGRLYPNPQVVFDVTPFIDIVCRPIMFVV